MVQGQWLSEKASSLTWVAWTKKINFLKELSTPSKVQVEYAVEGRFEAYSDVLQQKLCQGSTSRESHPNFEHLEDCPSDKKRFTIPKRLC